MQNTTDGRRPTDGLRLQTAYVLPGAHQSLIIHMGDGRDAPIHLHRHVLKTSGPSKHSPIHTIGMVHISKRVRIMGNHKHRGTVIRYLPQQPHDDCGAFGIQISCRFIGDQQFRLVHQRSGDGDAAHLATRELLRIACRKLAYKQLIQQMLRALRQMVGLR